MNHMNCSVRILDSTPLQCKGLYIELYSDIQPSMEFGWLRNGLVARDRCLVMTWSHFPAWASSVCGSVVRVAGKALSKSRTCPLSREWPWTSFWPTTSKLLDTCASSTAALDCHQGVKSKVGFCLLNKKTTCLQRRCFYSWLCFSEALECLLYLECSMMYCHVLPQHRGLSSCFDLSTSRLQMPRWCEPNRRIDFSWWLLSPTVTFWEYVVFAKTPDLTPESP